ncbi:hypothetical protein [Psychrosphaera algicola]|uniref:Uncharacterized protein n=2 Tax=Psychrosphaera TaxID=907197 RepID=A0ABT5FA57_9GAMM|nr:hypothetical protein [Psychrosphaera sp. G1-22]MDC2888415.1 hypothetical protein [Psychrosphaera sp. G1-22]
MDYISHLDVLNPEANASIMASWTNFSKERDNNTSLIEQLQTTLDIEQLLAIYLNALAGVYKVNAIRLETFQNTFTAGTPKVDSQKLTLPIRIDNKLMGKISYFTDKK